MRTIELSNGVVIREFKPEDNQVSHENPLLLLNGIGAGVEHWGGFTRALGRFCIGVDARRARTCQDKPSMGRYSEVVAKTIEDLGYDCPDILGLSWGGALAQETAIRHGNRLGKVVLAATTPGILQSVPPTWSAMAALSSSDRSSDRFMRMAGRVYGGDIRDDPALLHSIGIEREVDDESYQRQLRAIQYWPNTLVRLRNMPNETLVMAGEDDPIARPINLRMMALFIPRAKLHIVPRHEGGGHLFLHTRPEESAEVINDFLTRDAA